MLPPEAIQEFKTLYQNHFGEQLSDIEAERKAEKLLSLYRAVCLPFPNHCSDEEGSLNRQPQN